jgi:hypothetical protein
MRRARGLLSQPEKGNQRNGKDQTETAARLGAKEQLRI